MENTRTAVAAGPCGSRRAQALILITTLVSVGCQDMTTQEALTCIGAVALGTTVGALADKGKGAAIGAAAGAAACIAIHLITHQTKNASQVDADFRSAHNGQLPAQPAVVKLDVEAKPSGVVRQGDKLTIVSNFEVVSGKTQPITSVTAQINLYEYGQSQPFKTFTENPQTQPGSGAYQTEFGISLPSSMPQGQYRAETVFFLNNQRVASRSVPVQVA